MVAVRRLRGRETHRPGTPSFAQYQLLFAMTDRDELSAGELAAAADLSPATVTHMLDSLVELGLVRRSRSEIDRRIVTCSLTPAGRERIAGRRALFEERWTRALADVPIDDLAAAAGVFDRIAAMFDDFDAGVDA
jgi:DNA-binding MarR family transcriptional regulator